MRFTLDACSFLIIANAVKVGLYFSHIYKSNFSHPDFGGMLTTNFGGMLIFVVVHFPMSSFLNFLFGASFPQSVKPFLLNYIIVSSI